MRWTATKNLCSRWTKEQKEGANERDCLLGLKKKRGPKFINWQSSQENKFFLVPPIPAPAENRKNGGDPQTMLKKGRKNTDGGCFRKGKKTKSEAGKVQ